MHCGEMLQKGPGKRFTDLHDLQMHRSYTKQNVTYVDRLVHVTDDGPHCRAKISLPLNSGVVHLVTTSIKWCLGAITLVTAPKIRSHLLHLRFPPPPHRWYFGRLYRLQIKEPIL